MVILLDADSLAYKASAVSNTTEEVQQILDDKLYAILKNFDMDDVYVFVRGVGNFRKLISKTNIYKGNRVGRELPAHLNFAYNHLLTEWQAIECHGFEADDYIAMYAKYFRDRNEDYMIYSIDHDLQQIEGYHYNYDKDIATIVSLSEANFMLQKQILTGDNGDNIKFNKGTGEAKALKLISPTSSWITNIKAIREVYIKNYADKYADRYRECRILVTLVNDYNLIRIEKREKAEQLYF